MGSPMRFMLLLSEEWVYTSLGGEGLRFSKLRCSDSMKRERFRRTCNDEVMQIEISILTSLSSYMIQDPPEFTKTPLSWALPLA